jgi:hypothetical protein
MMALFWMSRVIITQYNQSLLQNPSLLQSLNRKILRQKAKESNEKVRAI